MKLPSAYGLMAAVLVPAVTCLAQDQAKSGPAAIPADQFAPLLTLIKPQPGELRFHEIPWLIDVWEARRKASAEGKPILVWSGAGGAPIGVC
jgi:hypothetical protein